MKRFVSLLLAFVLASTSVSSLLPRAEAAGPQSSCENGECIDRLIDRLQDLGQLYQNKCLPSEGLKKDLETYYAENGLTEECWRLISEINDLETQLQRHQARLEERLGCDSPAKCQLANAEDSLNSQLTALTKVEHQLSCTEPKKQEIKNQCPGDLKCALFAGALGIGGFLAEKMLPDKAKLPNCHLGNDSCATQLATGFLKSVVKFFESAWDLLAAAGKVVGQKMGQFWNWVQGAEDHSSTSQLALAKASEDPGVFKMLLEDFPGTMKKIWEALVTSLKEWIKADLLCQKWEGTPHFSRCSSPTESFDCVSCKALVNGVCAVSGYVISEIVPSFLTGGLVTAVKHGANGAARLAKLFKVSNAGMKAFRESRLVKLTAQTATKIDDALRLSKGLKAAKVMVGSALKAINRYLLSPTRKVLKESFQVITRAMKKGSLVVMESKAGKILVFQGKILKTTGKVIMYPVNNPMTDWAYKAGERSFGKLFKLGPPKLAAPTGAVAHMIDNDPGLEGTLARLEEARFKFPKSVAKLEGELLEKVAQKRPALATKMLSSEDVPINDLIRNLYPELQYSELAKALPAEQILKSEKELFDIILDLPDSARKERLLREFQLHRSSLARKSVVKISHSFERPEVLANAGLSDELRIKKAFETIGVDPAKLAPKIREEMTLSLTSAQEIGTGSVYHYSSKELAEKMRILKKGGFTTDQADELLRSGLVGKLRPEDTLVGLSKVAIDEVDSAKLSRMLANDAYAKILRRFPKEDQQKVAKALNHLENGGFKPEEAANIFDAYGGYFLRVIKSSDNSSDAPAYLAEVIRKHRKSGVSEEAILKKLENALKECK